MCSHSKDQFDRRNGSDRGEGLGVVNAESLPEALGNKTRFELADRAVAVGLDDAHHHARDSLVARWNSRLGDRLEDAFVEHLIHLDTISRTPLVRIGTRSGFTAVLGNGNVPDLHVDQLRRVRVWRVTLRSLSRLPQGRRPIEESQQSRAVSHSERW